MALTHNSKVADYEPQWSDWIKANRKHLPANAFAIGNPQKRSSLKYPHHWIKNGKDTDGDGIWDKGDMYLHVGGLQAAWKYAMGARSGQKAPQEVIDHLKRHFKAIGIEKEEDYLKPYVQILKTEDEHKVVKGVVYAAGYVDTDGETMTPEDVRKMAWDFLANRKEKNIDIQHDWKESGCVVVESYFLEKSDGTFPDNSWIIAVKCTDEIWEKVKKGELNGFSFGGYAEKYPKKVLVEVAKTIVGETEANLNKDIIPEHQHNYVVYVDKDGKTIKGITDTVFDHYHVIKHGTATEMELEHNHRIDLTAITE